MARPREFDRDTALQRAIDTFAMHGFEGTSTPMLLEAMNIGRQSLYDTFGDKRSLYLEALKRYSEESVGVTLSAMFASASVLDGIEKALLNFAVDASSGNARACLGIHAVTEFGTTATDVAAVTADVTARGELAESLDPTEAAQFLLATLSGLKVAARGGASRQVLEGIVRVALR